MNQKVQDAIDNFFGYFEARRRFLSDLPCLLDAADIQRRYGYEMSIVVSDLRLLAALVDLETLGRVADPDDRPGGQRLAGALAEYSEQSEWQLVSLPEMWHAMRKPVRVRSRALARRLDKVAQRREWQQCSEALLDLVAPGAIVRDSRAVVKATDVDRPFDRTQEALRAAGVCVDEDLQEVLRHFTHAAILYRDYRCGLAHESRRLAYGYFTPASNREEPHYWWVPDVLYSRDRVPAGHAQYYACLVIPDAFVLTALANCIRNVRRLCEERGFDPYQRMGFE